MYVWFSGWEGTLVNPMSVREWSSEWLRENEWMNASTSYLGVRGPQSQLMYTSDDTLSSPGTAESNYFENSKLKSLACIAQCSSLWNLSSAGRTEATRACMHRHQPWALILRHVHASMGPERFFMTARQILKRILFDLRSRTWIYFSTTRCRNGRVAQGAACTLSLLARFSDSLLRKGGGVRHTRCTRSTGRRRLIVPNST